MKITRNELIKILLKMHYSNSTEMFNAKSYYRDPKRQGEIRSLNGAFNVKAYEVGGPPAYDPIEKRLFWVCDMQILTKSKNIPKDKRPNPYRSIPWEGIISAKIAGVSYEVID